MLDVGVPRRSRTLLHPKSANFATPDVVISVLAPGGKHKVRKSEVGSGFHDADSEVRLPEKCRMALDV